VEADDEAAQRREWDMWGTPGAPHPSMRSPSVDKISDSLLVRSPPAAPLPSPLCSVSNPSRARNSLPQPVGRHADLWGLALSCTSLPFSCLFWYLNHGVLV
jgi:hypothetical protein